MEQSKISKAFFDSESLKRVYVYLKEFVILRVPRLILLAVAIELVTQHFLGTPSVTLSWHTPLIALTLILGTLMLRISDDSRDFDTDQKYFPSRPLPSGRVTLGDLRLITWAASIVIVVANLIGGNGIFEVVGMLFFLYLVTKWYFLPEIVKNNRFAGILANLPFFFFLYGYVVSSTIRFHHIRGAGWIEFALPFWIYLPLLSFDVARKTNLPKDELPGYQTYSAMIGMRPSIALSFAIAFIHAAVVWIPWSGLQASTVLKWGLAANVVFLGSKFYDFVRRVDQGQDAKSIELTLVSARYWMVALVVIIAGALL